VIERLQAHIKDQRLKIGDVILRYTFSAGIAEWTPARTLEKLYREADQALYLAKEQGRNLVRNAS
jgi:diguanylate cyclase (GGDEF)-like protein